jgi:uracil-DNA glycosylase family 4
MSQRESAGVIGATRPGHRISAVPNPDLLSALNGEIVACRRCPRLVEWRERMARDKRTAFEDQEYWGRPVPGFGDPAAGILIVGLAPAAHGGNRTGRIFTGDRSGDFLFAALHRCGLSNQAVSRSRQDGLRLRDVYVAAVNRCCPPANRPTPRERDACLPYLATEVRLLDRLAVILALGAFAWDGAMRALATNGHDIPTPRPRFGHGVRARLGPYALVGSFHPSQQNTFTGKLTPAMLDEVLRLAVELQGRNGQQADG